MADQEEELTFRFGTKSLFDYRVKKDLLMKEAVIATAHINIVREKLQECALEGNVNQFRLCKELREEYMKLQRDQYRGMIFPEDLEPKRRCYPGVIVPEK
eukprot:CAMPEP_0202957882 /NCGR_PEP_ID=MMETSP1396-20130829/2263_1 /ASSEMBLY_ACC=CAM_ASM_000872 /TAXON_ID= /ORGANISM="Pseudokeronopsis sp., Strain Brazil" /LENGTH=99 /DNA_ID=CAMNT_0049675611 /DNA_START=58 /DNA_END=357 /DNA_ORIENTATION=-